MFRKIIKSKLLKLIITSILIYFAFKKVDIVSILKQLSGVSLFSLFFWLGISMSSIILLAYRWSFLLIKKPKFSDISIFAKSIWSSLFYGLFVPTSLAGDVFKWIIIDDKYKEISKTKLAASILLDRFIGMSTLVFLGFGTQFLAKYVGVEIPEIMKLIFWLLFGGCLFFYGLVFSGKTDLLLKHKWFDKIKNISELVDKNNRIQILKVIGISFICDFLWMWQIWMIGQYFGANFSFIEIFTYLPVISTILILPISFAGFGAREQLYLYFFSSSLVNPESILLTSTVSGIVGILNSLVGGLVILTPEYRKNRKK